LLFGVADGVKRFDACGEQAADNRDESLDKPVNEPLNSFDHDKLL
jgi:hypothetical protein